MYVVKLVGIYLMSSAITIQSEFESTVLLSTIFLSQFTAYSCVKFPLKTQVRWVQC